MHLSCGWYPFQASMAVATLEPSWQARLATAVGFLSAGLLTGSGELRSLLQEDPVLGLEDQRGTIVLTLSTKGGCPPQYGFTQPYIQGAHTWLEASP